MKLKILYDEKFLDHYANGFHPERPERLTEIRKHLEETGLWQKALIQAARPATIDELESAHNKHYVSQTLAKLKQGNGYFDADTFFSSGSYDAATCAAGGTIDLGVEATAGKIDCGFALVRPPGHHATRDRAMGFCIFNNIAVCAANLIKQKLTEKIWIFDWDVHHGNGTQDIFYDSPQVFYSSVHQWPFYPGSGLNDEIGTGSGKGYTANVPYPARAGDEEFIAVLKELLVPIMEEFKPQIILVSAGFDAHKDDLLGQMAVTSTGFAAMTRILIDEAAKHCGNKIIFALEGGYNVEAISDAIASVIEVINGKKVSTEAGPPGKKYKEVLDKTKLLLSPHWKGIL